MTAGGTPAIQARQRLYPFMCGFDATDMGSVDMAVKRIKEFPGMWEGIGEIMSRHDDLTNLTSDERPCANHPALHRLSDFAGTVFLPLSIHHNIAPVSAGNIPRLPLYLNELEELVDEHPQTQFMWCHAGVSRRVVVDNLPKIIHVFLAENNRSKHVHIDLSWVVYDMYIYREATSSQPGIDNRSQWASLIQEFPNTFMIGSDKVANFETYTQEICKYTPLFKTLSMLPTGNLLVQNLALNNFYTLMQSLRKKRGGLGATLPPTYLYPEENYVNPKKIYPHRDAKP